jgi:hypothetical protein
MIQMSCGIALAVSGKLETSSRNFLISHLDDRLQLGEVDINGKVDGTDMEESSRKFPFAH